VTTENPRDAVEAGETGTAETGLVDTHCHLFLLSEKPGAVLETARERGVGSLICVGIDPESSRRSVDLAESFRGVFATAGMHPHTASKLDDRAGAVIEELLANRHVVGVGETGLDQYRKLSPEQDQERSLRVHIALSREHGKPLVVHVREAWDRILQVLDEERAEQVVFHCFSGDPETAAECVARGYFLSFAGNLTYPANEHLRAAAASAPMDRLLVETDSPFLSPQSLRGRDNSPANVVAVVEEIARVRREPVENIAAAVSANARAAFPDLR
jgi:TatD DNase family protein